MRFSSQTTAVTITFNPDLEILKEQLESLTPQCNVILVDNGSREETLKSLEAFCRIYEHVQLITLDENIGISQAQNVGIQKIMDTLPEVQFVLLLDHDSVPNDGMVQGLENEFTALHESGNNIAALGPLLYDPRDRKYLGFHLIQYAFWKKITPAPNSSPVECHSLNSSGSLISIEALIKVGLLEKGFFMDHGETEWCFRAMSKGCQIFGSAIVTMNHLMGDEVCEYWFFGRRRMPYRSPQRHYYIIRNSMLLQKRSYVPLTWKFWNILKIVFTFIYFGIFSKESVKHRYYIWKGVLDGLKGVTGKLFY